ncbi:MAG TPA: hypothetical protein VHT73_00110, partial [Thermodesulfobacteriota bacterium]|nr:hypothetical protein [Thermodesulfobacteriota bacterium]
MKYSEYSFIDIAFDGVFNRNNLIQATKVKPYAKEWKEKHKKNYVDCYKTYFRYPHEMLEHFKIKNTVSGYTGSIYSDFLPIDVDSKDLAESLQRTKEILLHLQSQYDEDIKTIRLFFSGFKGFRLEIFSELFGFEPSPNLHHIFRTLVKKLLPDGITVDESIYDNK